MGAIVHIPLAIMIIDAKPVRTTAVLVLVEGLRWHVVTTTGRITREEGTHVVARALQTGVPFHPQTHGPGLVAIAFGVSPFSVFRNSLAGGNAYSGLMLIAERISCVALLACFIFGFLRLAPFKEHT